MMSVINKAKDRDHTGRIKRKYTRSYDKWNLSQNPGWWVNLYMNRPKRRENKRVCHQVMKGVHLDQLITPLGNHKPHEYFW